MPPLESASASGGARSSRASAPRATVSECSTTGAPGGRVAFADAYRALAILAVIASHLLGYAGSNFDYLGTWGVACFFVLSGFLLSPPYLRAIDGTSRAFPSTKAFWVRRFLRIYPLYAAAVLFSVATAFPHHRASVANVVAHLTMTHGFFVHYAYATFNGPLWTMAVDAQFYFLLPLVAFGVFSCTRTLRTDARQAVVWTTLVLAIALSVVIRAIVYTHSDAALDLQVATVFARNVVGFGAAFALGIAIALVKLNYRKPPRVTAVMFALIGVVSFAILASSKAQDSADLRIQVMYDLVASISAATLLYGLGEGSFRSVDRATRLRGVATVAGLAYGLYLFHKPVTYLGVHFLSHRMQPATPLYAAAMTAFALPVTFALAWLGNRFVEQPFLRIKEQYSGRDSKLSSHSGDESSPSRPPVA